MFTQKFLVDTAERAVTTFAEAYVAAAVVLTNVLDFNALKIAAAAGVLSLFKAFAASKVGDKGTASLV